MIKRVTRGKALKAAFLTVVVIAGFAVSFVFSETTSNTPAVSNSSPSATSISKPGQNANRAVYLDSAETGKETDVNTRLAGGQGASIRFDHDTGVPAFLTGTITPPAGAGPVDSAIKFLTENKNLFQMKDPRAELSVQRQDTDALGMEHIHLAQVYQGVPVFGADLAVHYSPKGKITAVNGKYIPWIKLSVKADISADKAVAAAQASLGSPASSSKFEPPQLVVLAPAGKQAILTWKITLASDNPQIRMVYFVDAHSGSIAASYNDLEAAKNRLTYSAGSSYSLPGTLMITEGGFSSDTVAETAYKNVGLTYDYYYNNYGRDSIDNNGMTIVSTVHYGKNYNNSFWNGYQIVLGDGDGNIFTPLGDGLDVVAHEITHGVTQHTAGLIYSYQSGALNESYSDVLGELAEPNPDWQIGESVYTPQITGDALRSLSDPPLYGQPDNMSDYVNTTGDNGGVHLNSGIPNKAAYDVAMSIGKDKMGQIWYRALTEYLTSGAQFTDARDASVQAATDLYGAGSAEVKAVQNGFAAVGIGGSQNPISSGVLSVVATNPASGANGVFDNAKVSAVFSDAVVPATLNSSSFKLTRRSDGSLVNAQISYDAQIHSAILTPVVNLDPSTTYDVSVTSAISNVGGDHLPQTFTWSFTTAPPPKSYYFSWYDMASPGMRDWLVMGNPRGSDSLAGYDVFIGNNMVTGGMLTAQPGQTQPVSYAGVIGGPVKVNSLGGEAQVISQRTIFGSSFEEVDGLEDYQLDSSYFFTWYDAKSAGARDWILISNPGTAAVDADVFIAGKKMNSSPFRINAGGRVTPEFPGVIGGPVEVMAHQPGNLSLPQKVIVSQRVIWSGNFNEVLGIPASQLASDYHYTWYDMKSRGASDWILISNPNSSDMVAEISIGGRQMTNTASGSQYFLVPAGGTIAPTFPGKMAGPVEVKGYRASTFTPADPGDPNMSFFSTQRSLFGLSFEEVVGYGDNMLASDYYFSWYDQLSGGFTDWLLVSNPGSSRVKAEVWIGGARKTILTLPAGSSQTPTFPGTMGGPVEVRGYDSDSYDPGNPGAPNRIIFTSQRVMWNGHFNEVEGVVLK